MLSHDFCMVLTRADKGSPLSICIAPHLSACRLSSHTHRLRVTTIQGTRLWLTTPPSASYEWFGHCKLPVVLVLLACRLVYLGLVHYNQAGSVWHVLHVHVVDLV